jgi:RNA polymerase sigma-70 factor (ECF subfamily)
VTCFRASGHHGGVDDSSRSERITETSTDAQLLRAAQSDPQAFRAFYERYAVWVHAWFQRQTGSDGVALDLTAETFAQAWHSLKRFRDLADGSGAPWLFGIARNLLRQYHKHNRIETAARQRLGLPVAFAESEDYERVDERMAAAAMAPALAVAVEGLPADQRRALELRVVDQLPYEEVAGRLGCSENAARLRVSRALRHLTVALGAAG